MGKNDGESGERVGGGVDIAVLGGVGLGVVEGVDGVGAGAVRGRQRP